MPPRYPPIAPRAPTSATPEPAPASSQPARIEDFSNLDVAPGEDGYAAQLDALARDRRRFLSAHHPIKDALHMALQQPAGALLQRYADTLRAFTEAQQNPGSDDPTEPSPFTDTRPAIVAYTETMVAKALLGDLQASALIGDRIEGKPGLRKADLDAETAAQRERVRSVIGALVESMVERRGDNARVIDAQDIESNETEST